MAKRLIDASPLDRMIMRVPDDVYDAGSYIRGVEDVLDFVRSLPTENDASGSKQGSDETAETGKQGKSTEESG